MARTTIRTEDITASEVTTAKMAVDPTNASNLSSGSVPLAQLGNVDTSGITANKDDIALLGFKVAANGSLARYNLVDQSIDAFEDASGVDASASTNEARNASNYYSGKIAGGSGGTESSYTDGGTTYKVHTFTSNGDFVAAASGVVDVLMVGGGGGGGGGYYGGGGGGAGGFKYFSQRTLAAATYASVIGSGGAVQVSGTDTTFDGQTALGGGRGGDTAQNGTAGGSGGGGGSGHSPFRPGGAGTANQGNQGGRGYDSPGQAAGGGGGGASAAASDASGPSGTAGGNGYTEGATVYDWEADSGATVAFKINGAGTAFAGGGGSSGITGTGASGGTGGGGTGGGPSAATAGAANTGGGGGSAGGNGQDGAGGGSGIVIIRYADDQFLQSEDMTLVSNAQTAQSVPDTGDLVITITNGSGTTTVNTDIKAYISRDGSAYTSAVTLASQGTTGGHTILTANGVDLSGIASGTSMRWKIETLNQSVSKETRIQAVSLGWS